MPPGYRHNVVPAVRFPSSSGGAGVRDQRSSGASDAGPGRASAVTALQLDSGEFWRSIGASAPLPTRADCMARSDSPSEWVQSFWPLFFFEEDALLSGRRPFHADLSTVLSARYRECAAEDRYRFLARGAAAIGHAIALRVIEKPAPARMFFAGIWFVIVADATDLRAAPNDAVVALGLQCWLRRANVHSASSRNLEED